MNIFSQSFMDAMFLANITVKGKPHLKEKCHKENNYLNLKGIKLGEGYNGFLI